MRNALVVLALAATPFWLTGCSKSCDDLESRMEELALNADPSVIQEMAELGQEYAERCLQ